MKRRMTIKSIILFKYKLAGMNRRGVDVEALVFQMEDIEKSYNDFKTQKDYESMWKALKEILKS